MECDKCKRMLTYSETANKVQKDIGLESGGLSVLVDAYLCEECFSKFFKQNENEN